MVDWSFWVAMTCLSDLLYCTVCACSPLCGEAFTLNESLDNRARHPSASLAMDIYMIPLLVGTMW